MSIIKMPNMMAIVHTMITIHTDEDTVELVTMSIDYTTNALLKEQYSL